MTARPTVVANPMAIRLDHLYHQNLIATTAQPTRVPEAMILAVRMDLSKRACVNQPLSRVLG